MPDRDAGLVASSKAHAPRVTAGAGAAQCRVDEGNHDVRTARRHHGLARARTSSPANTSEKPQLSSEVSMPAVATKATAPRPVRGQRASQSIARATTGAVATT